MRSRPFSEARPSSIRPKRGRVSSDMQSPVRISDVRKHESCTYENLGHDGHSATNTVPWLCRTACRLRVGCAGKFREEFRQYSQKGRCILIQREVRFCQKSKSSVAPQSFGIFCCLSQGRLDPVRRCRASDDLHPSEFQRRTGPLVRKL